MTAAGGSITLGGTTYYYRADPLGYTFYEYRADLGGYAPVDPSDAAVPALLALVPPLG